MTNYNIREFQDEVEILLDKFPYRWSNYAHYAHLVEEVGELGEAMTVYEGDRVAGSGESAKADHSDLKEEIGDILFALVRIANKVGVDLDDAIEYTEKRYLKKLENYKKEEVSQ